MADNNSNNNFNFNDQMGGYGALLGGGLGSLFSNYKNPADSGMHYLDQLRQELPGYYQPYMQHGEQMYGPMSNQYNMLMNDPGGRINQIGESYKQSPGFKLAMQDAMQASNSAAAAGGMSGTPQHQRQNMELAERLNNQYYNDYLKTALGQYNVGLGGANNIYNTGANAASGLGNNMAQLGGAQAQLAYEGQNANNQRSGGILGSILGGLGGLAMGGPAGASMGAKMGHIFD